MKDAPSWMTAEQKSWTLEDWQKNDPKGLEVMSRRDPETAQKLVTQLLESKTPKNLLLSRKNWTLEDWQEKDPKNWREIIDLFPEEAEKIFINSLKK